MDRYDELQRLKKERAEHEERHAELYAAWIELLQAYVRQYWPTRVDPDQWSHEEVLMALRHMTRLLKDQDSERLSVFGKGDFPAPQNFGPRDQIDET